MAGRSQAHNERIGKRLTSPLSRPDDFIGHIVYAAEKAQEFVAGMGLHDFTNDDKTTFAVIRAVEMIGEAAQRVPSEVCNRYPEITWRRMIDMRNRLIHNYDEVDLRIVWDVVANDVPQLLATLGTNPA